MFGLLSRAPVAWGWDGPRSGFPIVSGPSCWKMDARAAACLNDTLKAPFYVASRNAQPSPFPLIAASRI
jgi:hypothetical protein